MYNFKIWNWQEPRQYMRAAVFADSEAEARDDVKNWLKRDMYMLFETINNGVVRKVKI